MAPWYSKSHNWRIVKKRNVDTCIYFSKMIQINISLIDTCMNIILHLKLELFVQSK